MVKAIPVMVYRGSSDCTNGGVSSKYTTLFLACDEGYLDVSEDAENLVKVVMRNIFGQDVYHVEPWKRANRVGWMFGGNFVFTSDSRFSKMCGGQYAAIAIHDRQE